ncbi:hypothetical protein [Aquimarina longa]|uniref:hypothetical protein n=1 Tax=Aquimarina longa TaxID=1080221 RepID=UPI00078420D2|nr:hypothetical protein [Aquimarina longa]
MISIIAAFSQLLTNPKPPKIAEARSSNIALRNDRDKTRDEIFLLIDNHLSGSIGSEDFKTKVADLRQEYSIRAENSNYAKAVLDEVKAEHKVRGFNHLNFFLSAIGLPIFLFCISILLYIISVFLKRVKYSSVAELVKLISQVSFITSLVYIIWAISPKMNLDRSVWMVALLTAAYISYRLITWFLAKKFFFSPPNIGFEKLSNVSKRLFDFIIIEVNEKFISEEQKEEYIRDYHKEFDTVSEIIKK